MNIKSLNLHDLKPYLPMPEKEELHVWTIPAKSLDNLHKSQREYSHILLRKIISAYTNISEEDLEFTVGEHGKPALLNVSNLNFNLSHSGAYIVFIFSCTCSVGIDIEQTGRKADMDKIAARIFLPSEAALLKNSCFSSYGQEQRAFLKVWVPDLALLLKVKKSSRNIPSGLYNISLFQKDIAAVLHIVLYKLNVSFRHLFTAPDKMQFHKGVQLPVSPAYLTSKR